QPIGAPAGINMLVADTSITITTVLRLPTGIAASSTSRPFASSTPLRTPLAGGATAADPVRATDVAAPVAGPVAPDERDNSPVPPDASPAPPDERGDDPGSPDRPTRMPS